MMDHRCRHFRDQASQFQWWLHTWCLRAEKVSQGDVNRGYIRNTAQAIFASLSHDHKYHKWTSHWQSMSLSNLLKDLAPFCCMAFSECSVGSKSPWKLWPSWAPGISWPWQRSLVPVLCTLLNLNSTERKLATQPDSCCRSKKNTDLRWIYGESLWWISMVNLYGESLWWIYDNFDGMMIFTVGF